MLEKIVRYIKGYYIILVNNGNIHRFLNLIKINNINIYKKSVDIDTATITVASKHVKKLEAYAKKVHVNLEVKKRIGLKYFFDKYRKRKVFFIFCFVFVISIYISSLYIWTINIEGTSIYSDVMIEKYVKENLLPIGTKASNIDCAELEKSLREEFDKLAWVSCDINGSTLTISVSETIPEDRVSKCDEPCNIVAVKDAVVIENIVNEGVLIAKPGDEVKKGDILIAGSINILNEYDELIETTYVSAYGMVYGEIVYNYEDIIDLNAYEKVYTGKIDNTYSFYFMGNVIKIPNIFKSKIKDNDVVKKTDELEIFDYQLPFGICKESHHEYEVKRVSYTEEEANEKARKRLELYIDELRKKGVAILENNVKIEIKDGQLIARGTIVTKELIGMPSSIILNSEGDTP